MRKMAIAFAVLLSLATSAAAQDKPPAAGPKPLAAQLEASVRKLWEAFKNKDKAAVESLLDDRFREVEEGATGFGDKKAEAAMVDEFEITTYTLKDFKITPLGPNSALVNYLAHYEGKAGGESINTNTAYGEVWVGGGKGWKALYVQETALK